ncbi:hypothetical protein SAMN05192534_12338 [Alteribacillus persepolensis]|uniref:Uncharacterized protein n=1 Tax=Alteribacillus persepolensis TaxID=568899 RepID=A0A1G8I9C4_9BACI|nr:hypothetical protein [Alteribacillus persepolensis]SDI15160.1 hypothetical protein SAMN05192534_12338 [Alteribacillus persepolensis]
MSLVGFAKRELAVLEEDGDDMQKEMNNCILEIIETFSKQGHSGFSASYAMQIIERILRFKPVTPLTGEDDEWNVVDEDLEQNKRCPSVFRYNKDNKTAYNIDGKIFSEDGGETWYTCEDSHVSVTFPYTPEEPERVIIL